MEHQKVEKLSSSIIWKALLWSALSGFLVFSFSQLILSLTFRRSIGPEPAAPVFLKFILPLFLPGLIAGLFAYFNLAKQDWIPRLTWLLLALIYLLALPLGTLVASIILAPFGSLAASLFTLLSPLLIFSLWVLLSFISLQAVVRLPSQEVSVATENTVGLLIGQILLALFALASWLPGMGTLIIGGTISLGGMTALALFGTAKQTPEERTPVFLLTLWVIPALTVLSIGLVLVLEF